MEKLNEMELEILIAIRNNETTESNDFYKLFDNRWPQYIECMRILSGRDLFLNVELKNTPGLKKYELTKLGNSRISQLLSERSHAVQVKLAHLRHSKNLQSSNRINPVFSLFAFFSHFSNRFRRQAHKLQ
ncbi:MAG TPA: hypothetical protein VFE04_09960 [Puia sp.]|nr:hypothetical protein [Puia sp.]